MKQEIIFQARGPNGILKKHSLKFFPRFKSNKERFVLFLQLSSNLRTFTYIYNLKKIELFLEFWQNVSEVFIDSVP